jgi:hypothetical protein
MRKFGEMDAGRRWWAPPAVAVGVLVAISAVVLVVGQRAVPHVVEFNLEGSSVSADETVQVRLEFSRPMDHKATEDAFSITPELAGEFSWSPRTVVYTSTRKPKPGFEYTVRVGESRDTYGRRSKAFSGTFKTANPPEGG